MSKKVKNVVHVRVTTIAGKEEKFYTTCGSVIETQNGGLCMILNYLPAPEDGKYMFQLYDPKPKDNGLKADKAKQPASLDEE